MSPSAIPGESPFSQRVTLTLTRNLVNRRGPPTWLFLWPRPTLLPSSLRSPSSLETEEWNKCSPPPRIPSARSAGSLATSPTTVPVHFPSVPSARLPTQKQSIAALTLAALRVAISNRSSPAAHPQWHAALTARKSTIARSGDCPSRPKANPDAPKVLSQQTQDSLDLAEEQAGPSTVLRSAPGAPPHTLSAPVLPRDAAPPRQRAHRTITDLAPRESGDESLDSNYSEASAQ